MGVDGTLLRLTLDEILAAPHEVLASLVQRYQDELDQALELAQARDDHAARAEEDRARLGRDLETAKRRIDELLNEQARMEDELRGRIEVLDKLRANVRELEREKKEATKRYREQAETHEAERQAWYDQESHFKMRVADLTASPTKRYRSRRSGPVEVSEESPTTGDQPIGTRLLSPADGNAALDGRDEPLSSSASSTTSADPAPPSATELSLAAQLASLTTAHDSLASSYRTLQTEMSDLKRVYQNLQEENESYEILLVERTLSGEVQDSQLFRSSAAWSSSAPDSSLYRLEEGDNEREAGRGGIGSRDSAQPLRPTRSPRLGSPRSVNAEGLDLAAELQAAEPVDKQDEEEGHPNRTEQARETELAQPGKAPELGSVEAELRQEVRALKDANKALTLYVSKIVDRVCQQEGFEKVLAVDYRQAPAEENTTTPSLPAKKLRPASIGFFSRQAMATSEAHKALEPATPTTTSHSLATAHVSTPTSNLSSPSPANARKSGGGLLESVTSVFSFSRASSLSPSPGPSPGGMKPLMLADSARKLDPVDDLEDEDDRRERARIHNEMVHLGFDPPPVSRLAVSGATGRRAASTSPRLGTSPGELDGLVETHLPALMSPEEQEQHARNELKEGRSSGFTKPPTRRMSIARRRQSLRRSPRPSDSPGDVVVGLGIDEDSAGSADYFGLASKSPSSEPPVSPSDEAPALRKAFRRLSAAFTSPSLGP